MRTFLSACLCALCFVAARGQGIIAASPNGALVDSKNYLLLDVAASQLVGTPKANSGLFPVAVDGSGYLYANKVASGLVGASFSVSGNHPITVDANGYLLVNQVASGFVGPGPFAASGLYPMQVDSNGYLLINQAASSFTGAGPYSASGIHPVVVDQNYYTMVNNAGTPATQPVTMDLLVNFETGNPGDLMTTANTMASIVGNTAGWSAQLESPGNNPLTHTYISGSNMMPLFPVSIGGTTYTGSGSRGLNIDMTGRTGNTGYEGMQLNSPTAYTEVTVAFPVILGTINTAISGDDSARDMMVIYSGAFAVVSNHTAGTLPTGSGGVLESHGQTGGGSSTFGAPIPNNGTYLSSSSLYYVTLNSSTANQLCTVVVQDSSGNLVGVSQCVSAASGLSSFILFSDYLDVHGSATSHSYSDNIAIGFGSNATIPFGPFTMPDPTSVSGSQTAQSVASVVWTSPGITFKIERSANAGASWTTLTSTAGISPYVDNTVSDLTTYIYRVTAILSTHSSNAVTTNSVTINNSLFPLASDSFPYGSNSSIGASGNWTITAGALLAQTSPQGVWASGSGPASCAAYWSNGVSWTTDQRSEVTCSTQNNGGFNQAIGPAVRMQASGSNWYEVSSTGVAVTLWKVIAGVRTQLQTAAISLVPGNRMSLQVSGSSPVLLSVQLDTGSGWTNQWTNIDPGASYLTGGSPGIAGVTNYGGDSSILLSHWQAFNEP